MKIMMDQDPAPIEITEEVLENRVLIPLLTCSTSLFAGSDRTDSHPTYCGSTTLSCQQEAAAVSSRPNMSGGSCRSPVIACSPDSQDVAEE